ncbi:hypothetical protein U1Q18_018218, partial [Sarracenia purpurea var. burkii]
RRSLKTACSRFRSDYPRPGGIVSRPQRVGAVDDGEVDLLEIDLPGCGMSETRSTNSLISFLSHEHRNCFPVSVDFPCEWWFPLCEESFPISGFNFSVDPPIGIASRSDWSAAEPFDQFAEP